MILPTGKNDRGATKRGFTLVEVIFVAVVMVLLLVAAVPRFQKTALRLRTEQAAFELVQLLRGARARSVTQYRAIRWVWDSDTRRAYLQGQGDMGEAVPLEGRASRSAQLPRQFSVTLIRDDVPVEELRFFPDGTSEATTLYVSSQDHVFTIEVDAATGQVLLSSGPLTR